MKKRTGSDDGEGKENKSVAEHANKDDGDNNDTTDRQMADIHNSGQISMSKAPQGRRRIC